MNNTQKDILISEMQYLLQEISNEICDGVTHLSWDRIQELNIKIEDILKKVNNISNSKI